MNSLVMHPRPPYTVSNICLGAYSMAHLPGFTIRTIKLHGKTEDIVSGWAAPATQRVILKALQKSRPAAKLELL